MDEAVAALAQQSQATPVCSLWLQMRNAFPHSSFVALA
jgi:hypothetical protein